MRSYVALSASVFGFLAGVLAVQAILAAWWDLREESILPWLAAAAVVAVAVLALRRGRPAPFPEATAWARERIVASSAVLAVGLLLVSLAAGIVAREPWEESLAGGAGGSAAVFAVLLALGYGDRAVRRRRARRRRLA